MEKFTEWLSYNWKWLSSVSASIIAILGYAIKRDQVLRQIEKELLDKNGDLKVIKVLDCNNIRLNCMAVTQANTETIQTQLKNLQELLAETRLDVKKLIEYEINKGGRYGMDRKIIRD